MILNEQRYDRHLRLESFGRTGQEKLLRSTVLLVGAGGLGSPVALYLAAAGVGHLVVVDDDRVELSNLQRQVLFKTPDIGKPKARIAAEALRAFNPDIEVSWHEERFSPGNAERLLKGVNAVIDGADNFPTRYLVNDAAYFAGVPVIHGSIHHFDGQVAVFHPPQTPCYRCLFPEPPPPHLAPSCAEAGVLGVLPGIIGTIQATEAIKLLTGLGDALTGRLLCWNALTPRQQILKLRKNEACPLCGADPTIRSLSWIESTCASTAYEELAPETYAVWRSENRPHLLLDVREPAEVATQRIPGSIHIPLRELPHRRHEISGQESTPIVCYCRSGVRSLTAINLLSEISSGPFHNLEGGIEAWKECGPVEESFPPGATDSVDGCLKL